MFGHGKGHNCMMCNMMFGKSEEESVKCSACGMTFNSKAEMNQHAKDKHRM